MEKRIILPVQRTFYRFHNDSTCFIKAIHAPLTPNVRKKIIPAPTLSVKPYRRRIIRNAIQCNHCGDIIESTCRHDFKTCSCGMVAVDGGLDYLRRCFQSPGDFTELSVTEPEINDP